VNPYKSNPELPECWSRPYPDFQRTLFAEATDQALAALKVSRDDVRRWQSLGWISFDVDGMDCLDWPHTSEIQFVRNIARSGLLDAQVSALVENLPKPFRFDNEEVAYHFTHGWVVPTRHDPYEVIEKNLHEWLDELAERKAKQRLTQLAATIAEKLEEIGHDDETE